MTFHRFLSPPIRMVLSLNNVALLDGDGRKPRRIFTFRLDFNFPYERFLDLRDLRLERLRDLLLDFLERLRDLRLERLRDLLLDFLERLRDLRLERLRDFLN